jgi:hypothetical protein
MAPHLGKTQKSFIMKTIRNRYSSRGHGARRGSYRDDDELRDEFSDNGMEDGWRNDDYYFGRIRNRRGYSNRDYAGGNYWPSGEDIRGQREGRNNEYVPSFDYGSGRGERYSRTTGYGDQDSPSMREYRHWRESAEPEGYAGRNRHDYEQGYGDRNRYQYNPGEYDRGGYRRNYEAGHYNRYVSDANDDYRGRRGDRYAYGEYESYPNYAADRRWRGDGGSWPRRSERFRNEPGRGYDRHRPYIREKRY